MLPFGMILVFAGYGVGSWGWVLVKGYNITLRQWFSPLNPFDWASGPPGTVPLGQIFPGNAPPKSGSTGSTTPPAQQGPPHGGHGPPPPPAPGSTGGTGTWA